MPPSTGLTILSVLVLLAAAAVAGLSFAVALWGIAGKQPNLAKLGLAGGLGIAGLYLVVLTGVGLLSRTWTLAVGTEKYFCEIDCHLAYSVTDLRRVTGMPRALGSVWAVTLRTRFDEQTISSHRPREAPLWPNPRRALLLAADGGRYAPLEVGVEDIARLGITSTPLTRELRPGDSYTTTLFFDLPTATAPSALQLTEGIFLSRLLIGNEMSPFHGRTLLALPAPSLAASR